MSNSDKELKPYYERYGVKYPLKPCPSVICKSLNVYMTMAQYRYVKCQDCEACGPKHFSSLKALEAWNTRTQTEEKE